MISKKSKTIFTVSFICSAILLISLMIPTGFAWLGDRLTSPASMDGQVQKAYFERGTGTSSDPYIIKRPVQLYYFSWLQDFGFFNKPDQNGLIPTTYFELDDDFIGTDENGNRLEHLADLDMDGYILPPVGTSEYPFIGNFDGNGKVIKNLTISNNDLTSIPNGGETKENAQIVGFFGVIGSTGTAGTVGSYTYDSSANSVNSFALYDAEISTVTPTDSISLIGIVAGYVNGELSEVAVCDSSVRVANGISPLGGSVTQNLSDYTLVGKCTDAYKDTMNVTNVVISTPTIESYTTSTSEGVSNEWGGSIEMQSMYNRLSAINSAANGTSYSYIPSSTYYYDAYGNVITSTSATAISVRNNQNNTPVRTYVNDDIGHFSISQYSTYNYLLGHIEQRTSIRQNETAPDGYFIRSGNNYLNHTGGSTVSNGTDPLTATVWKFAGGYLSNVINGQTYYLNRNGYSLSVGTTANTSWSYNSDDILSCLDGSVRYCLKYDSNTWSLSVGYKIADQQGQNYLVLNANNNAITDGTDFDSATAWEFSGGTSGYMSTVASNGTTYYLNASTTALSVSTTPSTQWNYDSEKSSIYFMSGNEPYYLAFNNSWTVMSPNAKISSGSNYLSLSGNSITNVTNADNATVWDFSVDGKISSNQTNYLIINNGTLSVGVDNNTLWTYNSDNTISTSYNGTTYYLQYNGTSWTVITVGYRISSGSNYLSINSNHNGITNTTNSGNATVWYFSNGTSGYMYTTVNGTKYYLNNSGGSFSVSTTQNTSWTNSNNVLSDNSGWFQYNIRYNNGWSLSRRNGTTLTLAAPSSPSSINITTSVPGFSVLSFTLSIVSHSVNMTGITKRVEQVADDTATYFPITVIDPSSTTVNASYMGASKNNTGYVISGSQYKYNSNNTFRDSDIRVSRYGISSIENSVSGNNLTNVRTRTWNSGGIVTINNTNSPSALKLQKYDSSLSSMNTLISNNPDYVYGLHFMDASISADSLVVANKAVIDHETYYNYDMPMDSIDFRLSTNGFINFFAGTYFDDNNSFFSLHQIFRYKDSLPDTAVICVYTGNSGTIYKCQDGNYYTYSNGTYTAIKLPSDFDTAYTQRFTHVYMNSYDASETLIYLDSSGSYYMLSNGELTLQTTFELTGEYVDINSITQIKKINEIYGYVSSNGALNNKKDFIYQFDGESSVASSLPTGYVLVFDTEWIESPTISDNYVYYYEVPVNSGEYALGSVDGRIGAYLLYLDISANAQKLYRTEATEVTTTTTNTYEYPKGVQLVASSTVDGVTSSGAYTSDINSVAIKLTSNFAGSTMELSRTGDAVTVTAGNGRSGVYLDDGMTLNLSPIEYIRQTVVITERVTQVDYNVVTGDTETIITTTTVTTVNGGTPTRTVTQTSYTVFDNGNTSQPVINNNPDDDGHTITPGSGVLLTAHSVNATSVNVSAAVLYTLATDDSEGAFTLTSASGNIVLSSNANISFRIDSISNGYSFEYENAAPEARTFTALTVNGLTVGAGDNVTATVTN